MTTYRLILSLPVGSSVEALTDAQRATIRGVRGRWTANGMPGTAPAGERYLIDVLTDPPSNPETGEIARVTRQMLDALGLPLWLIVGCWSWDFVEPAVTVVEPLDEMLYLPHMQADPETGATTLCEPHRWVGWPACIEVDP